MKQIAAPLLTLLLVIACQKQPKISKVQEENLRIDSINQVRQKINDSIQKLNEQNRFPSIAGTHTLSFSDDEVNLKGPINFETIGRDRYKVTGKVAQGNQRLEIQGELVQVSSKYLNFEGVISQTINSIDYQRRKSMTFAKEGKERKFRLQDKIGGQGFVEYIDIHF